MGWHRQIIRLLDRPGGRTLLGATGTLFARKIHGSSARIIYRGVWMHRLDAEYLIDGPSFAYAPDVIADWPRARKDLRRSTAEYWYHRYAPQAGDVIIDVGAGIGSDAFIFSRSVGPRGKVLAIEAHPGTFKYLERQCQFNGLDNVIPIHGAIMAQAGFVSISGPAGAEGNTVEQLGGPLAAATGGQSGRSGVEKNGRGTHALVPGNSLDSLCEKHGIERVDLLKMNIEGAERYAIEGMERTIRQTRHVCIACHDFKAEESAALRTRELVEGFLRQHGFTVSNRAGDPRVFVRDHVHGVRNT